MQPPKAIGGGIDKNVAARLASAFARHADRFRDVCVRGNEFGRAEDVFTSHELPRKERNGMKDGVWRGGGRLETPPTERDFRPILTSFPHARGGIGKDGFVVDASRGERFRGAFIG